MIEKLYLREILRCDFVSIFVCNTTRSKTSVDRIERSDAGGTRRDPLLPLIQSGIDDSKFDAVDIFETPQRTECTPDRLK